MGKEIIIDSLEDMCALMCDNRIPREKKEKKSRRNDPAVPSNYDNKASWVSSKSSKDSL